MEKFNARDVRLTSFKSKHKSSIHYYYKLINVIVNMIGVISTT